MAPLTPSEAKSLYDRIGAWQDTQAWYEEPALDALVGVGAFDDARRILEVGCGTGRFAKRLLENVCRSDARYLGFDVSPRMVRLAQNRLETCSQAVGLTVTDGGFAFDVAPQSQDRVVATYVLDLLSRTDIRAFLSEAHRVLTPSGRLCLVGLTWGRQATSRLVSHLWAALHSFHPAIVGGCRPIDVVSQLRESHWRIRHREVVTACGIPSEVLVATRA